MAAVGPVNPMPPVAGMLDPPYALDLTEASPAVRRGAEYGRVRTVLPYLLQDGYGRAPVPTGVPAVELANERLRATFLPTLGGRLWSLVDLDAGRELLHRPDVLQPANLGLRGAWFAGGVEWNIGTRGHSPLTCDPLHAAALERPDGTQVLRMWEYERMRGVVFHVDAWLPAGSPALFVGVGITNPNPAVVPMYWWSNTAVPETSSLVVRAPATSAYRTSYSGALERVPVGDMIPAQEPAAADYFYEIADDEPQPWIEAREPDGSGLVQRSTALLRGRKLFCWGATTGGRRWQDWLAGEPYCEIQAGLACTQYEHVPMPAGATWRWVESYGPATTDDLDDQLAAFTASADLPVGPSLCTGSGWGALEELRRRHAGEPSLADAGTPFAASTLGADQAPWEALITGGALPPDPPVSYVTGEGWRSLLAAAAPRSWATSYHLGVMAHADGDLVAAGRHYRNSIAAQATPWAQRALGVLDGDPDLVVAAHTALPDVWQLAVEAMAALVAADRPAEALRLVDALPVDVRARGRIRLGEALAAVAAGERDRAAALLRDGIEVDDLREGEVSLDRLWEAACPDEPLPARYDFRMKPQDG
ncbi:DUF5107 domain-containing protein [Pseudonocardia sp. TRM90224]|uniref:DUF5107 domain-containing protein n=1 Tax=Pseudonocardia sp. TRM90224 TaxID=2812678 RepID=UPI001E2A4A69|nr:DUF5107 domain-containing protein [Pseudonocardia sp. TRM90224]